MTAASIRTGVVGSSLKVTSSANAAEIGPDGTQDRRWQAYKLRQEAAMAQSNQPFPSFPTNGDEETYPNKIASYTKCLPHNERGEVDLTAYDAFLKALATGQHAAFEAIPMGESSSLLTPKLPMPLT